jgi:NADH dehydrogenase
VQRLIHVSGLGADDRVSKNRFVRSKVEAESSVVRAFPNATILRPSVVFGPEDAFFNKLARIAAMAPVVPLVGDGSAKLQPVYVGDVARAAVKVLERPDTARTVFELGGPRVYSYRELVALTLKEIDRKKPMLPLPAALMKLAGFFAEFQPALLGPPPITRDQADLLTRDNIVRAGARTLADLGIEPTAAEAILPTYLDRFRPAGRYNQTAPV